MLATMHGKEAAIAPSLLAKLGLAVFVPADLDTDVLGTFSGEVPRRQGILETAVAKANMAMDKTGATIGIASEGAYGPHPRVAFLAAGTELMVLVDRDRNIVIHEHMVDEAPAYGSFEASTLEEALDQLTRLGFPQHAVMVRAVDGSGILAGLSKGIRSHVEFEGAFGRALTASGSQRVIVMNDMRADRNPTRMRFLEKLAARFADRIATLCPSCGTPGFGVTGTRIGLPCEWCGGPTHLVSHEVSSCACCDHELVMPRSDGMRFGDPALCPHCNP
ncbi:hypothetical protein FE840_002030 [Peteryoungia desertarenae]|uniref:DUF6671 domain-containing protein n=1 Tax=Peteryoungia desertarenae TaxID=1813451 RepID=A0ABX6QIR4_9HYPH|nr:DUF6671 family protein [Peteryoungia desertarenae]QLF68423.1 hypothetical protein FE840_002030 [Peteryoungia desertarenae]